VRGYDNVIVWGNGLPSSSSKTHAAAERRFDRRNPHTDPWPTAESAAAQLDGPENVPGARGR